MNEDIKQPIYYGESLSEKIREISVKLVYDTYTTEEGLRYAKEIKELAELFEQSLHIHKKERQ